MVSDLKKFFQSSHTKTVRPWGLVDIGGGTFHNRTWRRSSSWRAEFRVTVSSSGIDGTFRLDKYQLLPLFGTLLYIARVRTNRKWRSVPHLGALGWLIGHSTGGTGQWIATWVSDLASKKQILDIVSSRCFSGLKIFPLNKMCCSPLLVRNILFVFFYSSMLQSFYFLSYKINQQVAELRSSSDGSLNSWRRCESSLFLTCTSHELTASQPQFRQSFEHSPKKMKPV
jgi:hypothetical protein